MSFPIVPTASGQVIPGVKFTGTRDVSSNLLGLDPCALLTGTLRDICMNVTSGGGGGGPVPGDPGLPIVDNRCGAGFTWSALFQRCLSVNGGNGDATPGFDTPAEVGATTSMHQPNGHADTIPSQREIRRRVCRRGSVLGKDGWCHQHIANKDRAYPKPRKALGTPGELNALRTSKRFAKRLLTAEKGIKETARDLAKAGGIKLGGR